MRLVNSEDLKGTSELELEWLQKKCDYLQALLNASKETVVYIESEVKFWKNILNEKNQGHEISEQ